MVEPPAPLPWEQQPDEPPEWYTRFQTYLALGHRRTLAMAVVKLRTGGPPLGVPAAWYLAHRDWNWRERAQAFDDHKRDQWNQRKEELRTQARDERLLVLRAARGKLVVAMQTTDAGTPMYADIVAQLTALNGEMRREMQEE